MSRWESEDYVVAVLNQVQLCSNLKKLITCMDAHSVMFIYGVSAIVTTALTLRIIVLSGLCVRVRVCVCVCVCVYA